jgi:hypothetical protein
MSKNEAETRYELIDPVLRDKGLGGDVCLHGAACRRSCRIPASGPPWGRRARRYGLWPPARLVEFFPAISEPGA